MGIDVGKLKRAVIKIGTSVITDDKGRLDKTQLRKIIKQIAGLKKSGREIIIITSGSIAAGVEKLGLEARPKGIQKLQAAASVGQGLLIGEYSKYFEPYRIAVGQVLLTQADFIHREEYLNAQNALNKLLELGIVPVINENDATAVEEIRFGDNDIISALVSCFIHADVLIMLSDVDGIYLEDKDGKKVLKKEIKKIGEEVERDAKGAVSKFGSGGMTTKVRAAKIVTSSGVQMVIANGRRENILNSIFQGDFIGTYFYPREGRLASKKHWIAYVLPSKGKLVVDAGARIALVKGKKSLLPAGVIGVEGDFSIGEAVEISDDKGDVFAKGITSYHSDEINKVKGMRTCDLLGILNETICDEVVHRDSLVIF